MRKSRKSISNIFPFFLMFMVVLIGTAFASIGNITGTIEVQAESPLQDGVFISDAEVYQSNSAEAIINTYSKRMLNTKVTLDASESEVIMKIKLYNNTNYLYEYRGISYDEDFYDNANIETTVYTEAGTQIGEDIPSKTEVIVYIKINYKNGTIAENTVLNAYINFEIGIPGPNKPILDNPSNEEWTNEAVPVTATTSTRDDRTQIEQIKYSFNNSSWMDWDGELNRVGSYVSTSTIYKISMDETLYVKAIDNLGQESEVASTKLKIDLTKPSISFGTNGSTKWAKSHSTTVTVSDTYSGVDADSLKYVWTQNTSEPADSAFSKSFANGGSIAISTGTGNNWYLWIWAKDIAGNSIKTKSSAFYLDNTAPSTATISSGGISGKRIKYTATGADANSGVATYKFYVGGSLKTTVTTSSGSATYTFSRTTFGNTYSAYVVVTDAAGNTKTSSTVSNTDYTIKTDAELSTLAAKVNGGTTYSGITITQLNSIILRGNWTPIGYDGTDAHAFAGTYNGGGYTISGLTITNGTRKENALFGKNSGTIKNLTISSPSITTTSGDYSTTAACVGTNLGTIEYVNITRGTIAGNTVYIGGITAYSSGGKIRYCTNSATVKCSDSVTASTAQGVYVGAMAGINKSNGVIEYCINTGNIKGKRVGGMVGELSTGYVTCCGNRGNIYTIDYTSSGAYAGGIAGSGGAAIIRWSYNNARIVVTGGAGGIIGAAVPSSTNSIQIVSSYNAGTLSGTFSTGGIVAYQTGSGTISLTNNYWRSDCGAKYGNASKSSDSGAQSRYASDLKKFTSTLNGSGSYFKADSSNKNGGYPILSFE